VTFKMNYFSASAASFFAFEDLQPFFIKAKNVHKILKFAR